MLGMFRNVQNIGAVGQDKEFGLLPKGLMFEVNVDVRKKIGKQQKDRFQEGKITIGNGKT